MKIDPKRPLDPPPVHMKARKGIRVVGVVSLGAGVVVLLIGLSAFVSAIVNSGDFSREPSIGRMFLMLPGLFMVGVGGQMCLVGWAGSIAKYGVREGAPAAAEGVNRVGMGAAPGIRAAAGAVAAGVRDAGAGVACPACDEVQDAEARFCDACGAAMGVVCAACGAANETGARFCDQCGVGLA